MNETKQIKLDGSTAERASEWIARLDRGFSDREENEFKAWLFENDENYGVFMSMSKLWDRMDMLSHLSEIMPDSQKTTSQPRRYVLPIAASFVLAVFVAIWTISEPDHNQLPSGLVAETADSFETGVGERSAVRLEDGTQIVLNTDSRVTIKYTTKNRFLHMERGEMHVWVAHDLTRPLSVVAADRVVQAVGTEFNVDITGEQNIELVVTEGVVMVGIVDSSIAEKVSEEPIVLTPSSILVAAGHEVVIPAGSDPRVVIEAEPIDTDEIAVKLSWREGNLIFRGESLEEAVTEVGRYTAVEFVFLDEESKKVKVAGLFRAGDVEGLLTALRQNFNISYEWVAEDKIALSGDRSRQ